MRKIQIFSFLLIALLFVTCSKNKKISSPSSFKEIITLYSSSNQSINEPIYVRFVEDVVGENTGKPNQNIFTITPDIEGELVWDYRNQLKFIPTETFASDQLYQVTVDIDRLFKNVPDSLKEFTFEFKTRKQYFDLGGTYLTPIQDSLYALNGSVICTDYTSLNDLDKIVHAKVGKEKVDITWFERSNTYDNIVRFKVDSIKRQVDPQELSLILQATVSNEEINYEEKVTIPALGDFKLVKTETIQESAQQIKLTFSDFIDTEQSLEGLIYPDVEDYEITIQDNYALIDFKEHITEDVLVTVEYGLLNTKQYKLQQKEMKVMTFEEVPPAVKLVNTNTILPYGTKMPFIFQTVGLNAVDVRITKIYQKNIFQFLQNNNLNNAHNVNYVGEEILVKKIDLSQNPNLHLWNKQVIDLKELIEEDPTALYNVEVGFRRSYTTYNCPVLENEDFDPSTIGIENDTRITEENFWSFHDGMQVDYEQRGNPCNAMFYSRRYGNNGQNKRFVTNILGSNLGVVAKKEKDGDLLVAITSINTTNPIPNTKVEVYNYKNRVLKTVYTDDQGIVKINNVEEPFLVVASSGNQRGYLKLRSSEYLSLSKFDVDGTSNKQDLKALLYAERGVWRPGDSLFVNLILEDKFDNLPDDYPIGFELRNPKGQIVERRTTSKGLNGHYTFWTKTDVDDITGDYMVKAYVGNSTFSKTIKVETIRPNRLKINALIGEEEVLISDSLLQTEITTNWLHGAPGKELYHKVDVIYTQQSTSFKEYSDYRFTAPYRKFENIEQVFLEDSTDVDGKIITHKKIQSFPNAPGFLRANFKIKAFEKGGRFSIEQFGKTFYPHKSYVGLKSMNPSYRYNFNQAVKRRFVNLDTKGEKLSDTLVVRLYKLDYNWWYDINHKEKYVYKGELNEKPVKIDTLIATGGEVDFNFVVGEKFREGRYLMTAENSHGHMTGEVLYFSAHARASRSTVQKGTKLLELSADKDKYKLGETVKVSIPTMGVGRVLVSIEDGQNILKTKWIKGAKEATEYSFTITKEMSPYVYVNVIYLQPHKGKENDLPLRTYGVIPIKVESKNARLSPIIEMADEIKPKKEFEVKISEEKKLPMTYTLAIVDEGLLDITHYKMPSVWNTFNSKPALEVKTWDVFDRVIKNEKFDVRNLLSIGGDGEVKEAPEGAKLNRFKPIVKFLGPFYCPPGETKIHKLNMPNYVGSVKVMVVAGHDRAYGQASKNVVVKNALMVLGTMPRVLGPNETIQLPVDVFAMKDHVKEVSVEIKVNDLFETQGGTNQKLSFSRIGDQQLLFDLKTKEKFGVGKIELIAKSGNETASYTVELAVRPSNSNLTVSYNEILSPGVKYDQVFDQYGYEGTNTLTVEVSSIPPINLKKRLDYLIRYPYGCVEQTTSSVFPQLFLTDLMDLSEERKREIEENVQAGIIRLKRFQTYEGGFSYWPGGHESHDWASNYAGHFLLEAKNKGYAVDGEELKRWKDYQTRRSNEWRRDEYSNLAQSYRLYLLAKAQKPNIGAMNRLRLVISENSLETWYLASAYNIIGKKSIAEKLLNKPKLSSTRDENSIETFGSGYRNQAIILHMLSELNMSEEAYELANKIAERLNENKYMSTQTTAYCLLAVSKYVGQGNSSHNMLFDLVMGSENEKIKSNKSIWQKSIDHEKRKHVIVTNITEKPLFLTVIQNGIPKVVSDTLNESKGLRMYVKYTDMNGIHIDPTVLHQGEDFIAEVTVQNVSKRYQKHISLTQIFPSGWEIHNSRMMEANTWRNSTNYEDIRDDRVDMFYNLGQMGSSTFKVFLNASYKGKYYLPAITTEAMYDHEIRARKHGRWVEVKGYEE